MTIATSSTRSPTPRRNDFPPPAELFDRKRFTHVLCLREAEYNRDVSVLFQCIYGIHAHGAAGR